MKEKSEITVSLPLSTLKFSKIYSAQDKYTKQKRKRKMKSNRNKNKHRKRKVNSKKLNKDKLNNKSWTMLRNM